MRLAVRLAVTMLAVGLVFGMGVHYDVASEPHWPYPDADDLTEDYDSYIGERTFLFGTVQSVNAAAERATIQVEHSEGEFNMTVTGFDAIVEPGGTVQVLGTLESGYKLSAERVVVVNPSGGAELLKYGLSIVGALLVLVAFFRHWRIDRDALAFRRW